MTIFICGQSFISGGEHVLRSTLQNMKNPSSIGLICKDDKQIILFFETAGVRLLPFRYFCSLGELRQKFSYGAYPLKAFCTVLFAIFMAKTILTKKPQKIFSNNFSELPFSILSRLLGVQFIQYVHEIVPSQGKVPRAIRTFQKYVTAFICVSKVSQESVRSLLKVDQTLLLHNSTDLYPNLLPKTMLNTPLKLAFVGMLNPNKNPLRFLKWVQLLSESRAVEATVAYHLSEAETLKATTQYCQQHRLPVRWVTKAQPHEIRQILRDTDFLCITSNKEAFPLVALEALAMGTPIITSNNGGVPEIIEDEKTGFLVFVDDNLETSIEPYLNSESYQNLSQNCLLRAQDFSREKHTQAFATIVENLN